GWRALLPRAASAAPALGRLRCGGRRSILASGPLLSGCGRIRGWILRRGLCARCGGRGLFGLAGSRARATWWRRIAAHIPPDAIQPGLRRTFNRADFVLTDILDADAHVAG